MVRSESAYTYFNMDDPVVGGYTPDKIALRRAISLAIDVEREIRLVRPRPGHRGAVAVCCRNGYGLQPQTYKSENSEFNPVPRPRRCWTCSATSTATATAGASMPDGSPLVLKKSHPARPA